VEQIDAGVYLTERLRAAQPEYFDQELERGKRKAGLLGFLLGGVATVLVSSVGVVTVLVFAPETLESLLMDWR
jgi:hypothetical protein